MWLDKQAQKNVERQTRVLKEGENLELISESGLMPFESDVLCSDGSNGFQFCEIQMVRRHVRRHNNRKAVLTPCMTLYFSFSFSGIPCGAATTVKFLVTTVTIAFLAI